MVSHSWGSRFIDTVAACVAAAQGKSYFFHIRPRLYSFERARELLQELELDVLQATFWICVLSVNQHRVICKDKTPWGPCPCNTPQMITGPFSEIKFFDIMMRWLSQEVVGFKQVIAVDDSKIEVTVGSRLPAARLTFGTQRSIGSSASRSVSRQKFGLAINWKSRCVVQVEENFANRSRRIFAGDIVESVNGLRDPELMRAAFQNEMSLVLQLRRAACVTTRIWVVAEVAEAHRCKIPQLVVSHFPLYLSGPEYRLRILAADVMKSEATSVQDQAKILARIGSSATDYNKRLQKVLLKTPGTERLFVPALFLVSACSWYFLLGFYLLLSQRITAAKSYFLNGLALAYMVSFVPYWLRYSWFLEVWHRKWNATDLEQDIRREVAKYLRPSQLVVWWRIPVALRLGLRKSIAQRVLTYILCALPHQLICWTEAEIVRSAHDCATSATDLYCSGSFFVVVGANTVTNSVCFLPYLIAIVESKFSLSGRKIARALMMAPYCFSIGAYATFAKGFWMGLLAFVSVVLVTLLFVFPLLRKKLYYLARPWRRQSPDFGRISGSSVLC